MFEELKTLASGSEYVLPSRNDLRRPISHSSLNVVIRGLIADFSRFEMIIHAKGGLPIVIIRHSIYDLRNKKGRCMLRSFQEEHRDWQKSALFVS